MAVDKGGWQRQAVAMATVYLKDRPGGRRVVEGRARDQRHHGRRGRPAAPLPRDPRRQHHQGRPPTASAPNNARTARGRRSMAARASFRPPSRPTWPSAWPATGPTSRTWPGRRLGPPEHGGVESARVFTHVWLAMVGRWDWDKLPAVPPELVFVPADWPLSIWSFACWARQTIVALSVISAHRPARPLPVRDRRAEIRRGHPGAGA